MIVRFVMTARVWIFSGFTALAQVPVAAGKLDGTYQGASHRL
jgi:hypothetical protein